MAKRFLTNIDLTRNELQNVVIHPLASAPATPTEGQIYYNTSDQRYYLRQNTAWKDVTGRLDNLLTTTNALTIVDNNDGTLTVNISDATGSNGGLLTVANFNLLTNATAAATPDTLALRDVNGDIAFNDITLQGGTIADAPVNPTDIVNKSYVDALVASGVRILGAIDASTNPNYPAGVLGDAYHISVAGLIGGPSGQIVEVGDLVVVIAATTAGGTDAAVGSEWIIMQDNIDAATTTIAGYIRIATQTEVNTGTDNTIAVTPLTMQTYVSSLISGGKFAVDIGDTVSTSIAVVHGLGTSDVLAQIRDTVSLELVETDVVITNTTTVSFGFTVAPGTNAYRVVISG